MPTGPLPLTPPPVPPLPTGPLAVAIPLDHRSPVRYTGSTPADGWRGRLFTATRGRLNPGASPAQLARQRLIDAIRRPLGGPTGWP